MGTVYGIFDFFLTLRSEREVVQVSGEEYEVVEDKYLYIVMRLVLWRRVIGRREKLSLLLE